MTLAQGGEGGMVHGRVTRNRHVRVPTYTPLFSNACATVKSARGSPLRATRGCKTRLICNDHLFTSNRRKLASCLDSSIWSCGTRMYFHGFHPSVAACSEACLHHRLADSVSAVTSGVFRSSRFLVSAMRITESIAT